MITNAGSTVVLCEACWTLTLVRVLRVDTLCASVARVAAHHTLVHMARHTLPNVHTGVGRGRHTCWTPASPHNVCLHTMASIEGLATTHYWLYTMICIT